MALRDRWVRRHMETARQRLLVDINDGLEDLIEKMNREDAEYKKQCRLTMLCNFIGSLFDGRYNAAKRALIKIVTLKPQYKPVSPQKSGELLLILWQSASVSRADIDALIEELGKMDEPVGVSENELPFL